MLAKKRQDISEAVAHISDTGQMIDDNIVTVSNLEFYDVAQGGQKGHIELVFPDHT